MQDIYILGGARTPFGSFGGSLKDITPTELGAVASKEAIKRSHITPDDVDLTVIGNVIHSTKNASYLARHIALKSGISIESPALTVNRLCGSGLQAVVSSAQSLMLGDGRVALSGGSDNMSLTPHAIQGSRWGTKLGAPVIDDMLSATLTDEYCGCGMGITAENLAEKYNITRENQDEFALISQQRAANARAEGRFAEEIVAVEVSSKRKKIMVDQDEHIRENTTIEGLSKLPPAFKKGGSVTSGNASGINDGASSVVLATESFINERNVQPTARIVSWGIAGVDPNIMGIGPVPATKLALKKAGMSLQDIDLFEFNEAFAAQFLAVEKELELDRQKVNVNGGAIALGHPVGASGSRLLLSLMLELKRQNKKYGLASLCIGGGQGISMIIESV